MPLYRTTLSCAGLSEHEGRGAPVDILAEFAERSWHTHVECTWNGKSLFLSARNDFDDDGQALLDEFRDVVIACVKTDNTIRFNIESIVELSGGAQQTDRPSPGEPRSL